MSQENEVDATIPIGLGGREISIYFRTGAMTGEEWDRFTKTLATLRGAVVDDRPPKPTITWGIGGGAGGGAGGALPPTGIVSVTTDLRIPSHAGCTCGHMNGVHRMNGTCTRCVTCFRFDGADTEPLCVCGCKKSVHGLSGVCSMCEQCSSYTENVGVPE
jgi:hypothetical protein